MSLLSLDQLRERLAGGQYRVTDHALGRVVERNISAEMIRQAGAAAQVIEDYPHDKYGPSCLLLGFTAEGTPLHIQTSRRAADRIRIITLYVPDPERWRDPRTPRQKP